MEQGSDEMKRASNGFELFEKWVFYFDGIIQRLWVVCEVVDFGIPVDEGGDMRRLGVRDCGLCADECDVAIVGE